jgi:hypothetical protein
MIWRDTPETGTSRERLADQLLEDVPSLCGNPDLAFHPPLNEAAQGVALYLDQIEVIPESMNLRHSRELLAGALDAAGETTLARRLRLFGNRIIYPARWTACGHETVWVLDLRHLITPSDAGMEMILFERVRIVLATFSDVWDATSGQGFLGLKGLAITSSLILGATTLPRKRQALSSEIRALCTRHLGHFQMQRGWRTMPALLTLLS